MGEPAIHPFFQSLFYAINSSFQAQDVLLIHFDTSPIHSLNPLKRESSISILPVS